MADQFTTTKNFGGVNALPKDEVRSDVPELVPNDDTNGEKTENEANHHESVSETSSVAPSQASETPN